MSQSRSVTGQPGFVKCRKPDCRRKVSPGAVYCCAACDLAHDKGHELDPYSVDPSAHWTAHHSDGCDQRSRERGLWKDAVERDVAG